MTKGLEFESQYEYDLSPFHIIHSGTGGSSLGVKQSRHEADHSLICLLLLFALNVICATFVIKRQQFYYYNFVRTVLAVRDWFMVKTKRLYKFYVEF
jgi:hypothetical protein